MPAPSRPRAPDDACGRSVCDGHGRPGRARARMRLTAPARSPARVGERAVEVEQHGDDRQRPRRGRVRRIGMRGLPERGEVVDRRVALEAIDAASAGCRSCRSSSIELEAARGARTRASSDGRRKRAQSCVPRGSSRSTYSAPTIANTYDLGLRLSVEKTTRAAGLRERRARGDDRRRVRHVLEHLHAGDDVERAGRLRARALRRRRAGSRPRRPIRADAAARRRAPSRTGRCR